jgi:hypothetical protein
MQIVELAALLHDVKDYKYSGRYVDGYSWRITYVASYDPSARPLVSMLL